MAVAGLAAERHHRDRRMGGGGHQLSGVRGGSTPRACRYAIDGPAGSGKSTVARAVAARLGLDYLDTGAMYRAVAFAALRAGHRPRRRRAGRPALRRRHLAIDVADTCHRRRRRRHHRDPRARGDRAVIDRGRQPGRARANSCASSGHGPSTAAAASIEGRDIGTVVFPDADVKVYLTARRRAGPASRRKEVLTSTMAAARPACDSTRTGVTDSLMAPTAPSSIDTTRRHRIEDMVGAVLGPAEREASDLRASHRVSRAALIAGLSRLLLRPTDRRAPSTSRPTARSSSRPSTGPTSTHPAGLRDRRRMRYMGKDWLWKIRWSGRSSPPSAASRSTGGRPTARRCVAARGRSDAASRW